MHRFAGSLTSGFHDRFGEGRVRVHRSHNLFLGGFQGLGQHKFRDHLRGLRANDVGSQKLAMGGVKHQLDEPLGFVGGQGAAAGEEWEAAYGSTAPRAPR